MIWQFIVIIVRARTDECNFIMRKLGPREFMLLLPDHTGHEQSQDSHSGLNYYVLNTYVVSINSSMTPSRNSRTPKGFSAMF